MHNKLENILYLFTSAQNIIRFPKFRENRILISYSKYIQLHNSHIMHL